MSKIIYVEGRPSAHHLHRELALSLSAKPIHIDHLVRWQDRNLGIVQKIMAWFLNSFILIGKGKFRFILVDNLHVSPVIMKKIGLAKNGTLVCHLGSHTLYFTKTNRFAKWTNFLHRYLLRNYDALICEGEMAVSIAKELAPKQRIFYSFLGLNPDQFRALNSTIPDWTSTKLLFIGNVGTDFRYDYKGIDIMLEGIKHYNDLSTDQLSIDIYGDWSEGQMNKAKKILSHRVNFLGFQNFYDKLGDYQVYIHCSRGDAFPTSSLEAMSAGLISIVSQWTGTKEIVEKVDKMLITTLDPKSICDTLAYVMKTSVEKKQELSRNFKESTKHYSHQSSIDNYKQIFRNLSNAK